MTSPYKLKDRFTQHTFLVNIMHLFIRLALRLEANFCSERCLKLQMNALVLPIFGSEYHLISQNDSITSNLQGMVSISYPGYERVKQLNSGAIV